MTEFKLSECVFKEMGEGRFWIEDKNVREFIKRDFQSIALTQRRIKETLNDGIQRNTEQLVSVITAEILLHGKRINTLAGEELSK